MAGNGFRAGGHRPPGLVLRAVDALTVAGAAIASALMLVTLATVGYSVVKRYVLGTPVTWTDELSGYLVVSIVMLGAGEALRCGDHISVDLLTARLRGPWRKAVEIWAMIAVLLVAAAIIYSAVIMVRFSYAFGIYSEGYLETAMWIPQSVLLAGAVVLAVGAAARLIVLLMMRHDP